MSEAMLEQVNNIIMKRIEADDVILPPMPKVALKCMTILKQPDFSLASLYPILEQDPSLVLKIVKNASSAAMGRSVENMSLNQAVNRLGAKQLRRLLVEAAASTVFVSNDSRIKKATRDLWGHSVAVAMLARDVSAINGHPGQDTVYMVGILHDAGKPVLAAMLLEIEGMFAKKNQKDWISADEWIQAIRSMHRPIGIALAKAWEMPETVVKCIQDCSEYDTANRDSIANFVCFANALAKQSGICMEGEDIEDAKALVMIGRSLMGVDDAIIERLTNGLKEKVAAIYR